MSQTSRRKRRFPDELVARPSKPWLTWILFAAFVLLFAAWLGGSTVMRHWRSWQAAGSLRIAEELMSRGMWSESARVLSEASLKAPNDPDVIRAIALFQMRVQTSPEDAIQSFKRLVAQGAADKDDLLNLARSELKRGDLDAAHEALNLLPPAERAGPEAAMLDAIMLKQAGEHGKAATKIRTALSEVSPDAESRFKTALLDYTQPYAAVHLRGRQQMWDLARDTHGAIKSRAVILLAADPALTTREAAELERLTRDSPGPERFAALGAWLKGAPAERESVLDRETTRAASAGNDAKILLAEWLAELNEHERLLKFIPAENEVTAAELAPPLLKLKLDALAQTHRWDELRRLLGPAMERTLGGVVFNLWHARLAVEQAAGEVAARQHLELALKSAKGAKDGLEDVIGAAAFSDQHDFKHLAAEFYQAAASLATAPMVRLAMMEKALTMHSRLGDTSAMLGLAAEIARLTPGNDWNAFRADYLALLAGKSMEVIAARIVEIRMEPGSEAEGRLLLLRALSAYRLRQPPSLHAALRGIKAGAWPPGLRAVLAAMIAVGGDQAAAFQIAERIPESLLLPEETRLLALAK
ncbi:MAG: hypothetical protein WAW39_26760 [Prosthecobacter sp.]|uniref:hypothetical protein n=1 Tax=Prosthecobacter sp. TaxID=1965333 RepID=UPI003BAFF2EE